MDLVQVEKYMFEADNKHHSTVCLRHFSLKLSPTSLFLQVVDNTLAKLLFGIMMRQPALAVTLATLWFFSFAGSGPGWTWPRMGVAQVGRGPGWPWPRMGVAQDGRGPGWPWPRIGVAQVPFWIPLTAHIGPQTVFLDPFKGSEAFLKILFWIPLRTHIGPRTVFLDP